MTVISMSPDSPTRAASRYGKTLVRALDDRGVAPTCNATTDTSFQGRFRMLGSQGIFAIEKRTQRKPISKGLPDHVGWSACGEAGQASSSGAVWRDVFSALEFLN